MTPAQAWVIKYTILSECTDGFRFATSDNPTRQEQELLCFDIPAIDNAFLQNAQNAINCFDPKHHPSFRRSIAYLSNLQYWQQQAWKAEIERGDKELEYVRSIISDFEAGEIETARQKVKKYISHLEKIAR